MTAASPVEELKVRARVRLNRARREGIAEPGASAQGPGEHPSLRDHLHAVAREVGFVHWEQARQVLSGLATPGDDMGNFWHAPKTGLLLHPWFAHHAQAQAVFAPQRRGFLLPYRRQCFIVQAPFIEALGLDAQDPAWQALEHDLVAGYGTPAWQHLAWQRIRAPLASFEARLSSAHANTTHRPL